MKTTEIVLTICIVITIAVTAYRIWNQPPPLHSGMQQCVQDAKSVFDARSKTADSARVLEAELALCAKMF